LIVRSAGAAAAPGSHNLLIGGSIITVMIGGAGITQLSIPAATSLRLAIWGDLLLGLSLVLNMLAVTAHSSWMDYATSLLIGIGYGAGFSGSLRHLTAVIPAPHRGQVMSAYYLIAYGSLAAPAVLAGAATSRFGLTPTYQVFAVAVALVCVTAARLGSRIASR
jgi:hypothetical protein